MILGTGGGSLNQQELEILQGTIGAVVFQNYDNGYAVLRLGCWVYGGEW